MQTVWSRVINAKCSCRCSSCLSPQAVVSRRATTAATKRRVRFGEVVTLFYSSLLATAAVADSNRKGSRRRDLDNALVKAKDDLTSVEEDQKKRLEALGLYWTGEAFGSIEFKPKTLTLGSSPSVGFWDAANNEWINYPRNGAPKPKKSTDTLTWDTRGTGVEHKNRNCQALQQKALHFKAQNLTVGAAPGEECSPIRYSTREYEYNKADSTAKKAVGHNALGIDIKESPRRSSKYETLNAQEEDLDNRPAQITNSTTKPNVGRLPGEAIVETMDEFSLNERRGRMSRRIRRDEDDSCRLTPRIIMRRETAVARLAHRLLLYNLERKIEQSEQPVEINLLCRDIQEINSRLESLAIRLAQVDNPHNVPEVLRKLETLRYPKFSKSGFQSLDPALLADRSERPSSDDMIAKLAYNLLVAETAPNIHTFNTLLDRLCYWRLWEPAWRVIEAIFECRIRPNELTMAAILRFYTLTGDVDGFSTFVSHMATPGVMDLTIASQRLPEGVREPLNFVASKRHQVVNRHKVIRVVFGGRPKYRRNPEIYQTLILGWLKFNGLEQAWLEYQRMNVQYRSLGCVGQDKMYQALLDYCGRHKDGLKVQNRDIRGKLESDTAELLQAWLPHLVELRKNGGNTDSTKLRAINGKPSAKSILIENNQRSPKPVASRAKRSPEMLSTLKPTYRKRSHKLKNTPRTSDIAQEDTLPRPISTQTARTPPSSPSIVLISPLTTSKSIRNPNPNSLKTLKSKSRCPKQRLQNLRLQSPPHTHPPAAASSLDSLNPYHIPEVVRKVLMGRPISHSVSQQLQSP